MKANQSSTVAMMQAMSKISGDVDIPGHHPSAPWRRRWWQWWKQRWRWRQWGHWTWRIPPNGQGRGRGGGGNVIQEFPSMPVATMTMTLAMTTMSKFIASCLTITIAPKFIPFRFDDDDADDDNWVDSNCPSFLPNLKLLHTDEKEAKKRKITAHELPLNRRWRPSWRQWWW